ncbi:MAG TPA: hypothetical protein VGK73_28990, partial [Polyangiaceae bacterium]
VATTANVMLFELPLSELETKLNADDLKSKDATTPIYVPITAGQTSAQLFSFLTPADETLMPDQILPYFNATTYPPESNTYTVILADGELAAGGQARMIQSFKLDPASTSTTVALSDTSTTLTYTADLESLQPTLIPLATSAITVNWRDVMLTALGGEFLPQQITDVRIAHYTETPAELETQFLDLEYIDEATYEVNIESGVSVSLDQLKDANGVAFPGITADGTWILALICRSGQCRNPAPWYITTLKPCQ